MIKREDIEELKKRDFLEKRDYYNKYAGVKSYKLFGEYRKSDPLVTIVMPIYNHPLECVERALRSAINQIDFDNYQIIVVDNDAEGKNDNISVVKKINSDKVIYFRNEKNLGMFGNWNRCILLARSEWITFLHSDDILAKDALKILTTIVMQHPEIDQLASSSVNYSVDNIKNETVESITQKKSINLCKVKRVRYEKYFDAMATSVKGALLKKECLLEIGGFRDMGDGLGVDDYICMTKYAYYFKTYYVDVITYLNGYGVNETLNLSIWYPEMIANYYMQLCLIREKNILVSNLYRRRYISSLYRKAEQYNSGKNFSGQIIPIDIAEMERDCGLNGNQNTIFNLFCRKLTSLGQKISNKFEHDKFSVKLS